jgi:hypothetical protein
VVYFGGFFVKLGYFPGFSLYIKLNINKLIKFKKLRDKIECPWLQRSEGQFRGQKSRGPLKMSLEMAHKVIVPQKNYVPQFLKQRDINSYSFFKTNFSSAQNDSAFLIRLNLGISAPLCAPDSARQISASSMLTRPKSKTTGARKEMAATNTAKRRREQ